MIWRAKSIKFRLLLANIKIEMLTTLIIGRTTLTFWNFRFTIPYMRRAFLWCTFPFSTYTEAYITRFCCIYRKFFSFRIISRSDKASYTNNIVKKNTKKKKNKTFLDFFALVTSFDCNVCFQFDNSLFLENSLNQSLVHHNHIELDNKMNQ